MSSTSQALGHITLSFPLCSVVLQVTKAPPSSPWMNTTSTCLLLESAAVAGLAPGVSGAAEAVSDSSGLGWLRILSSSNGRLIK